MKRIVSIVLMITMALTLLCSCAVDMEDMGSIIPMYYAAPQTDLDPTEPVFDQDNVKWTSLLFKSLTSVTDSGKIQNELISSYEKRYDEERQEYVVEFNLKTTKWNDGRILSADHVVYAWKRLLSPETQSPAAALLYDIKNAKAVKSGEMTIDELGVASLSIRKLEVQFEKPIDVDLFLEAIASPALSPMRDDVLDEKGEKWATNPDDIATNGEFSIRSMDPSGLYSLYFSKYYFLTSEPEKGYNQYVKPYRLISDFSNTPQEAIDKLNSGEIYYVGTFTADTYAQNAKSIKSSDTLSTYTYYFNCTSSVLSNAKVRKALSAALDRTEIASIIGLGSEAATGFVSKSATGSTMSKSFRKEAGDVYQTTADVEGAKALLAEAGVSSGKFSITYRDDREYDKAVAEYAKSVWESLGFSVSLVGKGVDSYKAALNGGNFDVIGLDYFGQSTNAYGALAPFAPTFSGNVVSVDTDSAGFTPHVTGYESEEYDALMDSVLSLTTRKERHQVLVAAEKILTDDCPATALVFYKNNYLASSELKGLQTSRYGYTVFTNAQVKNYKEKNAAFEAAEAEAAALAES